MYYQDLLDRKEHEIWLRNRQGRQDHQDHQDRQDPILLQNNNNNVHNSNGYQMARNIQERTDRAERTDQDSIMYFLQALINCFIH